MRPSFNPQWQRRRTSCCFKSLFKMASSNADDFFETLIHQNGSKIFLISLSTVCAIIWASGSYGVYWFVNHSSKAKPTLINRLIAKACLAGCQYYVFVQVIKKLKRWLTNRLPKQTAEFGISYCLEAGHIASSAKFKKKVKLSCVYPIIVICGVTPVANAVTILQACIYKSVNRPTFKIN